MSFPVIRSLSETESLPESGTLSFSARATSPSHPLVPVPTELESQECAGHGAYYMGARVQSQVLVVVEKAPLTIKTSLQLLNILFLWIKKLL